MNQILTMSDSNMELVYAIQSYESNRELVCAIKRGDCDWIRSRIMDRIIGVNSIIIGIQHGGRTMLHYACECGQLEVVQILYELGADLNNRALNTLECTPIQYAIREGHYKIVQFLIAQGVQINNFSLIVSLINSKHHTRAEIMKLLIAKGFDLNMCSSCGNTPLQYACIKNDFESVQILLEYGMCHNQLYQNNNGTLPIDMTTDERIKEYLFSFDMIKEAVDDQ